MPGRCCRRSSFRHRSGLAGHHRHHRDRGRRGGSGPVRVGRPHRRRARPPCWRRWSRPRPPPEVQARPTGDGGRPPEAKTGLQASPMVTERAEAGGRWLAAGAGGAGGAGAGLSPAFHGTHLPHAMVDLDSGRPAGHQGTAGRGPDGRSSWLPLPVRTAFGRPVRARPARRRTDSRRGAAPTLQLETAPVGGQGRRRGRPSQR